MYDSTVPTIRRLLAAFLITAALIAAGCTSDDEMADTSTTPAEVAPGGGTDGDITAESTPNRPRVDEELCWLAVDPDVDFERVAELLPEELREQMRGFAADYQAWEDSDRDPELQPEPPQDVFAHIAEECTPDGEGSSDQG